MKLYLDVPCSGFQHVPTNYHFANPIRYPQVRFWGRPRFSPQRWRPNCQDGWWLGIACSPCLNCKGMLVTMILHKVGCLFDSWQSTPEFGPCRWKCLSGQSWSCKHSSQFRHIPFCRALEAQNFDRTLLAKNLAQAYLLAFCILVWDSVYWAISVISLKWLKT